MLKIETKSQNDEDYTYSELLKYSMDQLNLDMCKYYNKISLPSIKLLIKSKQTIWLNFELICKLLHRSLENIKLFILFELNTNIYIDKNKNLLIDNQYTFEVIDQLLQKYIINYIRCAQCRSHNTLLNSYMHFLILQCYTCGSCNRVHNFELIEHKQN